MSQSADASVSSVPSVSFLITFAQPLELGFPAGVAYPISSRISAAGVHEFNSLTYQVTLFFEDPSDIGAGAYNSVIRAGVCANVSCDALRSDALSISVSYTVTGTQPPLATVQAATNTVSVSASALDFRGPRATVDLNYSNVQLSNPIQAQATSTNHGIPTVYPVGVQQLSPTAARLHITFADPRELPAGTYDDVITVNLCEMRKCPGPLAGSPITVNTRYVIDNSVAGPNGYTVRAILQRTGHVVWDQASSRLYVAVPGDNQSNPGEVVGLDPMTGVFGPRIVHGADPRRLAVSGDGQFIYATSREGNFISRFNLPALTPSLAIPLGGNATGLFRAGEIRVAPGLPNTIAVARYSGEIRSDTWVDLAVFDDATPRQTGITLGDIRPDAGGIQRFEWIDGLSMYGLEDKHLIDLTVSPTGLSATQSRAIQNFTAYNLESTQLIGDRMYFGRGQIVDLSLPAVVGNLDPLPGTPHVVASTIDSAIGRAFAISEGVSSRHLHSYDLNTLSPIASIDISSIPMGFPPYQLDRWGSDGLAAHSEGGAILLIHGAFVRP